VLSDEPVIMHNQLEGISDGERKCRIKRPLRDGRDQTGSSQRHSIACILHDPSKSCERPICHRHADRSHMGVVMNIMPLESSEFFYVLTFSFQ
jgi:hypothetical protein